MLSTDAPQIIEHINQSLTFTPTDAKWVPASARFVVLGTNPKGTGAMHMYELDAGECKPLLRLEKQHGFKCGTFGASFLEVRGARGVGELAGPYLIA